MLKKILKSGRQIVVPGVYDALSAKIAVSCGFEFVYMSGFAVAGSLLAKPDIGLVTASEMIERAGQIVDVLNDVNASTHTQGYLIADGDDGYGNEQNVTRLVQAYEKAGVCCIQLEDQLSPKRCGHMEGKEVVSLEQATAKIRAAVSARDSTDFLVMARTDARAVHGLDDAIRRGEAFLEAGADILFIEAPESIEELHIVGKHFPNVPLLANMVEDGKTPNLSLSELEDLGYQLVLRPVSALLAAAHTLRASYQSLLDKGQLDAASARESFSGFNALVGLQDG